MYTRKQIVEMMKEINFGDIDGYGDPNLDQYFLDNNYWDNKSACYCQDRNNIFFINSRINEPKSSIYLPNSTTLQQTP